MSTQAPDMFASTTTPAQLDDGNESDDAAADNRDPLNSNNTQRDFGDDDQDKRNRRFTSKQFIDRNILMNNFSELRQKQTITKTGRIQYRDARTIPVPDWNPRDMPVVGGIMVIGATESGKSNWVSWALCVNRDRWPTLEMYTGTKASGFWQRYLPTGAVNDGFNLKRLGKIWSIQCKRRAQDKGQHNINMALLFDDLQGDAKWNKAVSSLFTRGRNLRFLTVVMVQTKNGLHKHSRLNAKLVVVLRTLSHTEKREVAEQWLADFNITTAINLLSIYTSDHHAFIIDTRTSPPRLFVSKAPDMGAEAKRVGRGEKGDIHYKLGCNAFWENLDRRQGHMGNPMALQKDQNQNEDGMQQKATPSSLVDERNERAIERHKEFLGRERAKASIQANARPPRRTFPAKNPNNRRSLFSF